MRRKPLIVGMVGPAGSGKNYTAAALYKRLRAHDVKSTYFAFAARLKEICAWAFHDPGFLDEDGKASPCLGTDRSRRYVLQEIGMAFRFVSPDVWIRPLRRLHSADVWIGGPPDVIFVTDVRFPDEAAEIRRLGGLIVRCDPDDTLQSPLSRTEQVHVSEGSRHCIEVDVVVATSRRPTGPNLLDGVVDLILQRLGEQAISGPRCDAPPPTDEDLAGWDYGWPTDGADEDPRGRP